MRRFILLVLVVVFAFACKQKSTINKAVVDKSEMAMAMQSMVEKLKLSGTAFENGDTLHLEFDDFTDFHFTDSTFYKPGFKSMAAFLLEQAHTYDSIPSINHLDNVVNSCKSCHMVMCPGPLELINTLTFPTTTDD